MAQLAVRRAAHEELGERVVQAAVDQVFGAAVYYFEKLETAKFPDIGTSIWFMLVTFSTVDYGDYAPVTHSGRAITSLAIIAGVIFMSSAVQDALRRPALRGVLEGLPRGVMCRVWLPLRPEATERGRLFVRARSSEQDVSALSDSRDPSLFDLVRGRGACCCRTSGTA